jgi:hypothetical protein
MVADGQRHQKTKAVDHIPSLSGFEMAQILWNLHLLKQQNFVPAFPIV